MQCDTHYCAAQVDPKSLYLVSQVNLSAEISLQDQSCMSTMKPCPTHSTERAADNNIYRYLSTTKG